MPYSLIYAHMYCIYIIIYVYRFQPWFCLVQLVLGGCAPCKHFLILSTVNVILSSPNYPEHILVFLKNPNTAKVQETAASAREWCVKRGGHVPDGDMVNRIADLGASGKHPANIERDFHTLLKSFSRRLGAKLSTVRARTVNVNRRKIFRQCLFPDTLNA